MFLKSAKDFKVAEKGFDAEGLLTLINNFTSVIEARPRTLAQLGPAVVRLARLEGLDAHGRAVELRLAARRRRPAGRGRARVRGVA